MRGSTPLFDHLTITDSLSSLIKQKHLRYHINGNEGVAAVPPRHCCFFTKTALLSSINKLLAITGSPVIPTHFRNSTSRCVS